MVIKIVANIKKVLFDFAFINIIDDYQKFDSHKKARQVYELVVPFLITISYQINDSKTLF